MDHLRIQTLVPASAAYPRHSEASIVGLGDGTLLLAWSRFAGHRRSGQRVSGILESDNHDACIMGMRSSDGGRTWEDETVLVENSAGLNVMSPALARLPDGTLGLLYSRRESADYGFRVFCRSWDNGATWHQFRNLTNDGYITGTNDRFAVLSKGRLLAPLHRGDSWYAKLRKTLIARSDDLGATWDFSDPIELPAVDQASESGCWETSVAEPADGSVLAVMRTAMGTLFRSISYDAGVTWSSPRSLGVESPIAPGVIRRIPQSNDLLLVWNEHFNWREPMFGERKKLSCAVSRDGGRSWPVEHRHVIEDGDDCSHSYPSCTFHKGTVLVTYYEADRADPFGARSLKLARFPIEALYRYAETYAEPPAPNGSE